MTYAYTLRNAKKSHDKKMQYKSKNKRQCISDDLAKYSGQNSSPNTVFEILYNIRHCLFLFVRYAQLNYPQKCVKFRFKMI